MNIFPSDIRDVIAEVPSVAPWLRVLRLELAQTNFEAAIPIEIAPDPDTDRADGGLIEAVVSVIRERLTVRGEPPVVDVADPRAGE